MKTVKQVRKEMKGFLGSKAANPKKTKSARRKSIRKAILHGDYNRNMP